MLNYGNLNDVEFEYLCKDVMSELLGTPLQRFAPGRDGGVDLTDNVHEKNIVVQVKHYVKTDVSGLIRSLAAELPKVKKLEPKQYYVCCSRELSANRKDEIYRLFSDYMASPSNIITLLEIDDFLAQPEHAAILQKHFKLWIESTNVLTDLLTGDIALDCDALLNDIAQEARMFVKTTAFDRAVACLEKNNVLMLIGNPGVGKTTTSKMLLLHYAAQHYRLRYSTDDMNLSDLKRSLSRSRDTKEMILLDDCFGQAYFDMKQSQESELLSLIRHIKLNPNKLLIMNSRITIYQEAGERTPELLKSLEHKDFKLHVLDMTQLAPVEKAKILYNHLYFCDVPEAFRAAVRRNRGYRRLIAHPNYNPRIIEYICSPSRLAAVPPAQYMDYALRCLDDPKDAWKNEYERRLAEPDRLLLTTLFSLTDKTVPLQVVKQCYEHRISRATRIDKSICQFDQALARLQNAFVTLVDQNGAKMLSAANPSVNDFLRAQLNDNAPERTELLESSRSILQLKRLQTPEQYEQSLAQIIQTHSILSFVFSNEVEKIGFIAHYCILHHVMDPAYQPYIQAFVLESWPFCRLMAYEYRLSPIYVLRQVFLPDFCRFYGLDARIRDFSALAHIPPWLSLEELMTFFNSVDWLFAGEGRSSYIEAASQVIDEAVDSHCDDLSADEFVADVGSIAFYDSGDALDVDLLADAIEVEAEDAARNAVEELLRQLPEDFMDFLSPGYLNALSFSISGCYDMAQSYLSPWQDEEDDDDDFPPPEQDTEVDYIFQR